jgi:hypothetical protein
MDVSRHILISRYIHISDKFYGTGGIPNMTLAWVQVKPTDSQFFKGLMRVKEDFLML